MTRSLNVKPKTTEQHVIVRSDKSVTYVTNNKILRSTLGTIEANYWQARSIARPLCDNRAVTHATVLKQNCRYIDYSLIYMYVLYIAVLYNCSESDKQILKNIYFAYRMHIEHSLHSLPISSHYHDALLILAYGTYVWRPTANVLYCIVLYCIVFIQKFQVTDWSKEQYGKFFNGDSYIILNVCCYNFVSI